MKRGKATVVWELTDVDGAQRLVVDVDAPLRPFGADPTPPQGTRAPCVAGSSADRVASLDDDTELNFELVQEPPPRSATTEALLRALKAKGQRPL